MSTFDNYLRTIIGQAAQEACEAGAATFEAQHLLLAIAAEQEPTTRQILGSVGLDYRAIRDALDKEYEHSLRAAGMSLAGFDLPRPTTATKHPGPGASAKLALERCLGSVARKRDLRPAHLLLGLALAEHGTVPRAFALAGIDRIKLKARLEEALMTEAGK